MHLLRPDDLDIRAQTVDQPTALISIDVESDYNSRQYEALGRLADLLQVLRELDLPITAFVEGQFFDNRQSVCQQLLNANVDVQLHCYDHTKSGDDAQDLARGVAAFHRFTGRAPSGYRANTFRLTAELARELIGAGFTWDSSLLPGLAQGGNRHPEFSMGDYFVLNESLLEFPVATWRPIPLPLIHSYRLLLKPPVEAVFRRFGRYPRLLVYDMHMADLVWSSSLRQSPLPALNKVLYRYMWGTNRSDTFGSLARFVGDLRAKRYRFLTINDFYAEVAPKALSRHETIER